MTRINGSGFRPGYRLLYDYTIPCRGGVVTRHERGSTAGSGGLQEGFRLGADAMDRRDAPERSARRAAVAVCSTVGLLDCWARIKTDLLLKRCPAYMRSGVAQFS